MSTKTILKLIYEMLFIFGKLFDRLKVFESCLVFVFVFDAMN